MKNYAKISILTALLIACGLPTFTANISTEGKNANFEEFAVDKVGGYKEKPFVKNAVIGSDEELDVSKMFVQYGSYVKNETTYKAIRFTVAVKGNVESISFQRGHIEGTEDVGEKEVLTLYRGITAENQVYYYNPLAPDADGQGLTTNYEYSGSYYWACYTIGFDNSAFEVSNIPLTIFINDTEYGFRKASYAQVSYGIHDCDYSKYVSLDDKHYKICSLCNTIDDTSYSDHLYSNYQPSFSSEYRKGDSFNVDSLTISRSCDCGSSEENVEFTLVNVPEKLEVGSAVSVNIDGSTQTFEIPVYELGIKQMPNKTSYKVGEPLDLTGLVLNKKYSNESKDFENFDLSAVSFSAYLSKDTSTVSLTYDELTVDLPISVDEISVDLTSEELTIEAEHLELSTNKVENLNLRVKNSANASNGKAVDCIRTNHFVSYTFNSQKASINSFVVRLSTNRANTYAYTPSQVFTMTINDTIIDLTSEKVIIGTGSFDSFAEYRLGNINIPEGEVTVKLTFAGQAYNFHLDFISFKEEYKLNEVTIEAENTTFGGTPTNANDAGTELKVSSNANAQNGKYVSNIRGGHEMTYALTTGKAATYAISVRVAVARNTDQSYTPSSIFAISAGDTSATLTTEKTIIGTNSWTVFATYYIGEITLPADEVEFKIYFNNGGWMINLDAIYLVEVAK